MLCRYPKFSEEGLTSLCHAPSSSKLEQEVHDQTSTVTRQPHLTTRRLPHLAAVRLFCSPRYYIFLERDRLVISTPDQLQRFSATGRQAFLRYLAQPRGFQEDLRGNNKSILSRAFGYGAIAGVGKPYATLLRPWRW